MEHNLSLTLEHTPSLSSPSTALHGDMGRSNQEISKHPEGVNSDLSDNIGSMCEQSRNVAVNSLETQRNEDFVEEFLSSSSLCHQPPSYDVDLLSAIPVPLSVIPPGSIQYSGRLTCSGIDYDKVFSSLQTSVTDDNPAASTYPLNKRLKKSPTLFSAVCCHNRKDTLSWEDCLASLIGCRNPYTEVESAGLSETGGKLILPQYSNPVEQQIYKENHSIMQSDATVTIAVPGPKEASSSNAVGDRHRRAKITEAIKALEKSTPHFRKGTRASVLDDVIDYIKYLKLQIMALSQSRLGGDPIYHPFVHLEGFGHYMVHQQMPSEPLEEVVGRLMDSNMPHAIQLLESKGLELLPISSADTIVKASADKFS